MTDQAIADRVEIEALRGEYSDAVMMRDRARLASLFTADGVLRMPNVPVELTGRDEIRTGGERLQANWDFFVQTTHPGSIRLDGDVATGRAHVQELARTLDGREGVNFAIYHDRYRRTDDGWKFAERVYEVRYLDTTPLGGAAPGPAASFAEAVPAERLEKAAAALAANGFGVEILDDTAAARRRVRDLLPEGAAVFTSASETLRLSGIDADVNTGSRYSPSSRVSWPWTARPPPTDPTSDLCPGRRGGQRRRGHRDRLDRRRVGQRQPGPGLCRRGEQRDLGGRGAEGGARPRDRAAPDRGARPAARERPHRGGLRLAQRRQQPARAQRRAASGPGHGPAAAGGRRLLNARRSRPPDEDAGPHARGSASRAQERAAPRRREDRLPDLMMFSVVRATPAAHVSVSKHSPSS
ncbi:hypothetical protein GCM10023403_41490 [Pseudonocardia benzenivorans]